MDCLPLYHVTNVRFFGLNVFGYFCNACLDVAVSAGSISGWMCDDEVRVAEDQTAVGTIYVST